VNEYLEKTLEIGRLIRHPNLVLVALFGIKLSNELGCIDD
jgi:hypothetical protein